MDAGLHYFPLERTILTGEVALEMYEAHCRRHKSFPNRNIEDMLASLTSENLDGQVEYTNNFAPWQKFYFGRIGDFLFVRGVNHALSTKSHLAADMSLAVDVQFILGGIQ